MASKDFKKYAPWALGLVGLYYFKDVFKSAANIAQKPIQDAMDKVQASQLGIPSDIFPLIESISSIVRAEATKGAFEDSNEPLVVSKLNLLTNPVALGYFETHYSATYGVSPIIDIHKFLTPFYDKNQVGDLREFIKKWLYG